MYKCIEANVVKEVLLHCISGRNSKIVVRRLGFLVENGKRQDKVNQSSVMYKYKTSVFPVSEMLPEDALHLLPFIYGCLLWFFCV